MRKIAQHEARSVAATAARSAIHGADLLSEHAHFVGVAVVGESKEDLIASLGLHVSVITHAIASDTTGKVHVLLLDGDALGVDGAEVRVFEETDDVGLGGLLQSLEGLGLEAEVMVHVHSDASDESLEGRSWQQHIDRLLVAFDLSESDGARLVSHLALLDFLHAASSGGVLLDGLGLGTLHFHGHLGGGLGLSGNF